jgi:hypothetical protein
LQQFDDGPESAKSTRLALISRQNRPNRRNASLSTPGPACRFRGTGLRSRRFDHRRAAEEPYPIEISAQAAT